LILQAMARRPERRFPSTRALGQALLAFASDSVRSAYGPELGGESGPPPRPVPVFAARELPTTLGESAHVRAVPEPSQNWRRRLAAGVALLLGLGFVAWRLAQRSSPPAETLLATTPTPLRPAPVAAAPAPAAPATAPELAPPERAAPAPLAAARAQTPTHPPRAKLGAASSAPRPSSAAARAPAVPSRAPLPSDDPEDGFVDLSSSSARAR
jgi:hypothetical protein